MKKDRSSQGRPGMPHRRCPPLYGPLLHHHVTWRTEPLPCLRRGAGSMPVRSRGNIVRPADRPGRVRDDAALSVARETHCRQRRVSRRMRRSPCMR
jgi:hypothetical protein